MPLRCNCSIRLCALASRDHQVLPSVVARGLASRRAQAHTPDVAADIDAVDQLAGEAAYRQLAFGQHTVPEDHAVLQRLCDAGVKLAMIDHDTFLANAAFHQHRAAHMAIAVAAALRALVAQALRGSQDPLARQGFQHHARRLQGHTHQSIPN